MKVKLNVSRLIRRTHMYLALFLTPWILMYAVSTLVMHHRVLFTGAHQRVEPAYNVVREEAYSRAFPPTTDAQAAARQILGDLDLDGAFSVRGSIEDGELTILRSRPVGSYRVTYEALPGTVRVERQQFGMAYVLEMLHRRRGFQQPFWANDLWALIVDGVIVAILAWAVTGLWMWWEMARTRQVGAICLGIGLAFFALFMLIL